MPEYVMPGASDAYRRKRAFLQGYIEAALFCGVEPPQGHPQADRDKLYDVSYSAVTRGTIATMRRDCRAFCKVARKLLRRAEARGRDAYRLGADFWFTRNGHGVGFWSRDELTAGGLGAELSDLCGWKTDFPETDLYMGEDSKVRAM